MSRAISKARLIALAGTGFMLLATAASAQAPSASGAVSDALVALGEDRWESRSYTFADIGLSSPTTLAKLDSQRLVYLPVPLGLELKDAEVTLDSTYFRVEDRRTTFVVSIDGYPVAARAPRNDQGSLDLTVAVDETPRENGFVELGLRWSIETDDYCVDERSIAEILRVDPSSRFSFSYNTAGITNLERAWTALPAAPVFLVSGTRPDTETYDAAWRIGATLERQGKTATYTVLPAVGDTVDTKNLTIPPALESVPAFAALASSDTHTLEDKAEIGALLLLPSSPLQADIAIVGDELATDISDALDALAQQVTGADAQDAFQALRRQAANMTALEGSETIGLRSIGNRPVIAIAPESAGKAATLFGSYWRKLATTRDLSINAIDQTQGETDTVPLVQLGGSAASFDVLAETNWTVTFDLRSVTANGLLPTEASIDVSAAPGVSPSATIASVLLNDYLLGAARLNPDGTPTRIAAAIPPYAFAGQNRLAVRVQRQPASYQCDEVPQAFPAAVQPTSHILLGRHDNLDGFLGVVAALASDPELIVPTSYLEDPVATLPLVVRGAVAAGLSPQLTRFEAVSSPTAVDSPFLAFEDTVADVEPKVSMDDGRLVINQTGEVLIDVRTLNDFAVAEVLESAEHKGILVRTLGSSIPLLRKNVSLDNSSIAVITSEGEVLSPNRPAVDRSESLLTDDLMERPRQAVQKAWESRVPLVAILAAIFVFVILRALVVRKRSKKS